nr:MAG: hypothetical protein 1 [Leviviridae sp.]
MKPGKRNRSREFPLNEGRWIQSNHDGSETVRQDSISASRMRSWVMEDWVGYPERANSLYSAKRSREGGLCNGSGLIGLDTISMVDHSLDTFAKLDNIPVETHPWALDSTLIAKILARTGPMTPKVNVPLFLYELKDVPAMIRHAGDTLHKLSDLGMSKISGLSAAREAASANLAYKFGWEPLISDIGKIAKIAEYAKKRQEFLMKTQEVMGAVSKAYLGSETYTNSGDYDGPYPFGNWMITFTEPRTFKKKVTVTRWCSARWRYRDFQPLYYSENPVTPFQAVTGLNTPNIPVTVWKALPWTWLSDWFVDISSTMQAAQNLVYFEPTDICFMEHRLYEVEISGASIVKNTNGGGAFGTCTPLRYTLETKLRHVFNTEDITPQPKLPMWDDFKLSVLGSLATLRLLGR